MTETITNITALKLPLGLIRWVLIPLLCFSGISVANAGLVTDDHTPRASVVAPDSHSFQDQNDQWDLDALTPVPFTNTETSTGTSLAGTHSNHKHQVLTAFIPRAPPPKARIFVF